MAKYYKSQGIEPSSSILEEAEFLKLNGNPPWDFVNKILSETNIPYTVTTTTTLAIPFVRSREPPVTSAPTPNAFCLPGGKMAVYTGLFPVAQNSDAMAVVMGHEIAHALLRHGAQRMSQQKLTQIGQMAGAMSGMDPQQQQMVMAAMGYGYLLPYAREHETQADEVGLMLAAAACYDPAEAIPLWERMASLSGGQHPPEFASTHPNPANRIQHLQSLMPQAQAFRAKYCQQGAATASR